MDTIREAFAARLRVHRGDLTQEQFSARLGVPLRTYQKMEAGNVPQKASLRKLAAALGVSEASLFQLPQNPGRPAKLRLFELIATFDDLESEQLLADADSIVKARTRSPATGQDGSQEQKVSKGSG